MRVIKRKRPGILSEDELTLVAELRKRSSVRRSRFSAQLLERLLNYNRAIGNDALAERNIEKMSSKGCIMTGQQPGFLGGPAYTALKGVSALLMAKETGACPIFWLATEDHDIDEIDRVCFLDHSGNLRQERLGLPKEGRMVEDLKIDVNGMEVIRKISSELVMGAIIDVGESSYALFHAKFMAALFKGTGLVFMEPKILRDLSVPIFRREIEEADHILGILRESREAMVKRGLKPQLEADEGTGLFLKTGAGRRVKIIRKKEDFFVGEKRYGVKDLLRLMDKDPSVFSSGVKVRCIVQNALFPIIAYVAGPGELRYYSQLREYHCFHEVEMPDIVPRISATFINPFAAGLLKRLGLDPWSELPCHFSEIYPEIDRISEALQRDLALTINHHLSGIVRRETIKGYLHDAVKKMRKKLTEELLKRRGISGHALHYLRNLISPRNIAQERVLNWFEFQRFSKENLIEELLKRADLKFEGHHYCFLS